MTNTELLKEIISKSGLKYMYIAEKLGISYVTLNKKIHNITEFTASEIDKLRQILGIKTVKEFESVFFAEKVD